MHFKGSCIAHQLQGISELFPLKIKRGAIKSPNWYELHSNSSPLIFFMRTKPNCAGEMDFQLACVILRMDN